MIRTILTPESEDISIHLPSRYVGKKIEVFLYALEELTEDEPIKKVINNASLRGKLHLTDEQYNDFHQYAKEIRKEWD
jgi:hypothetical protein